MPSELAEFFNDLDRARLRVQPPKKSLFLCGGLVGGGVDANAKSLRDYLYRHRSIESEIAATVVLAEEANQLYRDTTYGDLITFEEEIARIASIVLVIAESPGSLAELGAFASNDTIRKALRVIVQEKYWDVESFIRYGPLQRVYSANESHVGVYPWTILPTGHLDADEAAKHYAAIADFVRRELNAVDKSASFPVDAETQQFYVIYWIIYLGMASSLSLITAYAQELFPNIQTKIVRNKIYCMQIAGWVGVKTYSSKTYYFARFDEDPFNYAFRKGVAVNDSHRRKLLVIEAIREAEKVPAHVQEFANDGRSQS